MGMGENKQQPVDNGNDVKKLDIIYEIKSILFIVFIALIIRTLFIEPFYIPSTSMEDTLLEGDYVFSTKFNYGYSKYSIPFSPDLFDGRILNKPAKRGDIVIFWPPHSMDKRYVKRLVGLPGDKIQMINSILYINDKPMPRKFIGAIKNDKGELFNKYLETLENGVSYFVLQALDNSFYLSGVDYNNTSPFYVPEGHYFFLGDSRDRSGDSRFWGSVPAENLIAKAQMIFFSTKYPLWLYNSDIPSQIKQVWYWLTSIRLERLFKSVYIGQNTIAKLGGEQETPSIN